MGDRPAKANRRKTQSFAFSSSTATLELRNGAGVGDNTVLFDDIRIAEVVPEGGFETPVQPANAWEQANGTGAGDLTGSAWTIAGGVERSAAAHR